MPRGTAPLDDEGADGGVAESGGGSAGGSFDNGCVDCHDYYEIHV